MNVLTLPAFKQAKIVPPRKAGAKDEISRFYNHFRYSLSGVKFENALCLIEFFYFSTFVCCIVINLVFEKIHSTIDAIAKLAETICDSRNFQLTIFLID